jgi:hypothetical protein
MRIETKGSGAVLWVGPTPVKASIAGRDCSRVALERRLGEYVGPSVSSRATERKPQPLREAVPAWVSYNEERQQHRGEKAAALARLRAKHTAELAGMRRQEREDRRRILDRDWRGKGQLLNAVRSVLAAEHSKRRAELEERHRGERAGLRERCGRFPDFEDWLCRRGGPALAQRWRHGEELPRKSHENDSGREREWEEIPPAIPRVPSRGHPRSTTMQAAVRSGSGEGEGQARASYDRHLTELLREHRGGRRDASRIDLEIAIRMRVTGHARVHIQRAIEERAPEMRPGERRDWKEYARRTVATAFGVPGDRQIERLAAPRLRWRLVEDRRDDERSPGRTRPETDRDR